MTDGYVDVSLDEARFLRATTAVMIVEGRGLEPDILEGDLVRVNLLEIKPRTGDAVVVRVDGRYLAGRWRKKGTRTYLSYPHPLTRSVDLSLHEQWHIVGTITHVVGRDLHPVPVGVPVRLVG